MTKINQEEYEVLKELDDKWKWIARDRDTGKLPYSDMVHVYEEKPFKTGNVWTVGYGAEKLEKNIFQFIQWEDEEPYNIAELIEEYEYHNEPVGVLQISRAKFDKHLNDIIAESEETEVKDKKWLQDSITKVMQDLFSTSNPNYFDFEKANKQMRELVNQLDEPEVLSQEFINEKALEVYTDTTDAEVHVVFRMRELQNLLVPKPELPVIPKFVAEYIEECKREDITLALAYDVGAFSEMDDFLYNEQVDSKNIELFARAWLDGYTVEEEPKYYVPLGVKRSRTKEPVYLMKADKEGLDVDWSPERYIKSKTESHKYRFTEQEIKDYDDRFWPFAVKVEELEE